MGSLPGDDRETSVVASATAQILSPRHPGLAQMLIAQRLKGTEKVSAGGPLGRRQQELHHRLRQHARNSGTSKVLERLQSLAERRLQLLGVNRKPTRPG